jgi:hypothetical protein
MTLEIREYEYDDSDAMKRFVSCLRKDNLINIHYCSNIDKYFVYYWV